MVNIKSIVLYLVFIVFLLPLSGFSNAFELGVGTHIRNYDTKKDYIQLMKQHNLNSFREDIPWNGVEKIAGTYALNGNLPLLDNYITAAVRVGIRPMLVLDYGNKLHTDNGYPLTIEQISAFADYAYWVANKYKGRVKYYEIWNEWLSGTGMSKKNKKYARLSDAAYFYLIKLTSEKIRQADPDAIIVAGSFNPLTERDTEWAVKMVKQGVLKYLDGLSIHPYAWMMNDKELNEPDKNLLKIEQLERRLKEITGYEVPLYITEMGYPNGTSKYSIPDSISAQWIKEYTYKVKERGYIKGLWWYDLINDGTNPEEREDNFGLFFKNLSPKENAVKLFNIAD
ncbi:cellulase family glycosylhydrolase [Klebsiella oxytoca]|uniref:cellulase family glycosylhydrolase n=1 Tax=Klebsiella oxytoca TaxID=571 RepID=UPI00157AE54E|nr:cellulase family glycosylhydrolase [Klebsiella oxytoca]